MRLQIFRESSPLMYFLIPLIIIVIRYYLSFQAAETGSGKTGVSTSTCALIWVRLCAFIPDVSPVWFDLWSTGHCINLHVIENIYSPCTRPDKKWIINDFLEGNLLVIEVYLVEHWQLLQIPVHKHIDMLNSGTFYNVLLVWYLFIHVFKY